MFKAWVHHCQHRHDHRTEPSVRQVLVDPIDPPSTSSLPAPTVNFADSPSPLNPVHVGSVFVEDLPPMVPRVSKVPPIVMVEDKFQPSLWNNCASSQGHTLTASTSPPLSPVTSHSSARSPSTLVSFVIIVFPLEGPLSPPLAGMYACYFLFRSAVLTWFYK